MKAHIVTHNLFSDTVDHVVNGNTLIFFFKYFFFLLLLNIWSLFNYNRACASNYALPVSEVAGRGFRFRFRRS